MKSEQEIRAAIESVQRAVNVAEAVDVPDILIATSRAVIKAMYWVIEERNEHAEQIDEMVSGLRDVDVAEAMAKKFRSN